jgi:hypothetical protein
MAGSRQRAESRQRADREQTEGRQETDGRQQRGRSQLADCGGRRQIAAADRRLWRQMHADIGRSIFL